MATNAPGTQPTGESNDPSRTGTTPVSPGVTTPNVGTVGSVGVYDQDVDGNNASSVRRTPTSLADDSAPIETRSGGPSFTWIIGAIVLILLIYFLWQWIF
jgi:hypothetical protein